MCISPWVPLASAVGAGGAIGELELHRAAEAKEPTTRKMFPQVFQFRTKMFLKRNYYVLARWDLTSPSESTLNARREAGSEDTLEIRN